MAVLVVGALCCADHMRPSSDRVGRWRTVRLTLDPTRRQIKVMEMYCLLDRRAYERALPDGPCPNGDSSHASVSRQPDVAAVLASIEPPSTPGDLETKWAVVSSAKGLSGV